MDVFLDSNILIYSADPNASTLQLWLSNNMLFLSEITVIEVLGYHNLTKKENHYFTEFIKFCTLLPISKAVVNKAIELRQQKSMSLGDSIIAATAITKFLPLVTSNVKDFKHLSELKIIDPFQT